MSDYGGMGWDGDITYEEAVPDVMGGTASSCGKEEQRLRITL